LDGCVLAGEGNTYFPTSFTYSPQRIFVKVKYKPLVSKHANNTFASWAFKTR